MSVTYYEISGVGIEKVIYGDVDADYRLASAMYTDDTNYRRAHCPNDEWHGPEWDFPENPKLHLVHRNKVGDFLWYLNEFYASTEFVEAMNQMGATGFRSKPVPILDRRGNPKELPTEFHQMYITGRVHVDLKASRMRVRKRCKLCGAVRYTMWKPGIGIVLKDKQDEYPDFARMVEADGMVLISELVKDYIISNNLKPCYIRNLSDLGTVD